MAQGEKRENSVLFSLRELRQIEENRVQEEENAVRSAEEARIRAKVEEHRKAGDLKAIARAALNLETVESLERELKDLLRLMQNGEDGGTDRA